MSKTTAPAAPVVKKNKGQISPKSAALKAPDAVKANNPFASFVASQQKVTAAAETGAAKVADKTSMPDTGTAVQLAAKEGFVRTIQNGRKDYTPNSIGALIWQTADKLQALTPNTPITSAIVRTALPHVKPASVQAGLSHWRKFHGTLRVKGAAAAAKTDDAAE